MKYVEIYVKTALSKSGLESTDYALNPYKGCEHRCVYCYSPYVIHMPLEEWNGVVYVKRNLPTVLDKELKKKKGFITIGTVTDAYQPAEKKYEITRKSLEVLRRHRRDISILTKSSLILRDIDIIERIPHAEIGVTITTLQEEWRRKIEPNASSIDERLRILEEFRGK
ncbi:radical SAM protein, partial [Euryarchaeota archaeon ex4484_178]